MLVPRNFLFCLRIKNLISNMANSLYSLLPIELLNLAVTLLQMMVIIKQLSTMCCFSISQPIRLRTI